MTGVDATAPEAGAGPLTIDPAGVACPAPFPEDQRVILGHGSGGQLSAALMRDLIGPSLAFGAGAAGVGPLNDAAVVEVAGARLAFTTDSFVVSPLRFPGGDIGELAVNGTVNDLAMMGAQPVAISLAYVIEEGLPLEELRVLTMSAAAAATRAGTRIVTGDTKVVGRGAADRLFVNTAGIGLVPDGVAPSADRAAVGDAIILSGPIGLHGVAIMSVREGLEFEVEIASDTQALNRLVAAMLAVDPGIHVLRDPTRGGLSSALNEIAVASRVGMVLDEPAIPIPGPVRAACEFLGLDPFHVANEGKLVAIVPGRIGRGGRGGHAGRRRGRRGSRDRSGRGRSSRDGHPAHDRGIRADRRHARRGAAAPDLLTGKIASQASRLAAPGPRGHSAGPRAVRLARDGPSRPVPFGPRPPCRQIARTGHSGLMRMCA